MADKTEIDEKKESWFTLSWWLFWIFLLLAAGFSLLVPAERTIHNWVKVIYFHGSIARNAAYFFFLAGLVSLFSFWRKELIHWASSLETVAIIFWLVQSVLGAYIMKALWGGFLLEEPKVILAVVYSFLILVFWVIFEFKSSRIFFKIATMVIGFSLVITVFSARNVFHPQNAIGSSPSVWMRVLFELITALVFLSYFFLAKWLKEKNKSWFKLAD